MATESNLLDVEIEYDDDELDEHEELELEVILYLAQMLHYIFSYSYLVYYFVLFTIQI